MNRLTYVIRVEIFTKWLKGFSIKIELTKQIEKHLRAELESLKRATEAALDAATNEESKPENKYDTRGLEASYLAGAQKLRTDEIEAKLQQLKTSVLPIFDEGSIVAQTALVEVRSPEDGSTRMFFLFNPGAGYPLTLGGRTVSCISSLSPVGRALLGKGVGEFIVIGNEDNRKEFEIVHFT